MGIPSARRRRVRPRRLRSHKGLGQRALTRSRGNPLTPPMTLCYGSHRDAKCESGQPKRMNSERAMESIGNGRLRVGEQVPPSPLPSPPYLFSAMVGMARCAIPARVRAGGTIHARRVNHATRCAATSRRGRRSAPSLPVEPRLLAITLLGRSRCAIPARVTAGGTKT